MFREPSIARHYDEPPQRTGPGHRSWITRGANFVVACTRVEAGAVLSGHGVDEHFVYALEGDVALGAAGASVTLDAADLAIVPPGDWSLRCGHAGLLVQLFTAAEPIAALSVNALRYADGAPEVAPPTPWPAPRDGYRLRHYRTLDAFARGGMVHAFCTRKLMLVPYPRFLEPRDETNLSPHAHADFEQGSIALEGEWLHHLRVPWTPDRRNWRADQHVQVGSPSTTIVPAGIIHTSQGIGGAGMRLIDVFAPPRLDFATRGWVENAAEYPHPADQAEAAG